MPTPLALEDRHLNLHSPYIRIPERISNSKITLDTEYPYTYPVYMKPSTRPNTEETMSNVSWYTETRKAVKVVCPECKAIGTVLVGTDGREGAMFACHKCGRIARTAQHIKAK
jgi:predicted RNA-binding Zn-ribbon protein involved in translation (DUF1610 family)